MINEELNYIIEKYHIYRTQNIIYGTNIPMPNVIIPTPWKTIIKFEKSEYFFFYFDENGIRIFLRSGEGYIDIPWDEVRDFKISHISILGKMTVKTDYDTYKFQINRTVIGCPWIKTNTKYLESMNYFYNP